METIKDYLPYKQKVLEDFTRVQKFFPLLTLSILPTLNPTPIFFTGFILPPEMNSIINPAVASKYGLKVRGEYHFTFPDKSVKIYDVENKINWQKVSSEHRHIYPTDMRLCTHHPQAEINSIPKPDQTVAILISAWQLFYQVKVCVEEGKEWTIDELPHGQQANAKLRREGWI